jgi:hypothetical protein
LDFTTKTAVYFSGPVQRNSQSKFSEATEGNENDRNFCVALCDAPNFLVQTRHIDGFPFWRARINIDGWIEACTGSTAGWPLLALECLWGRAPPESAGPSVAPPLRPGVVHGPLGLRAAVRFAVALFGAAAALHLRRRRRRRRRPPSDGSRGMVCLLECLTKKLMALNWPLIMLQLFTNLIWVCPLITFAAMHPFSRSWMHLLQGLDYP